MDLVSADFTRAADAAIIVAALDHAQRKEQLVLVIG